MQSKFFIMMVMIGLILSTALVAVEPNENSLSTSHNKELQKKASEDPLKLLQEINHHNTVFHDWSNGGDPYEGD
jgi:hypothetical protein